VGTLSVTPETLLHDPQLLILAPTPTTPGVHHLQPLNLKTILTTSHKVSLANSHNLKQAAFTGGIPVSERVPAIVAGRSPVPWT
jgi:hypothetical protein